MTLVWFFLEDKKIRLKCLKCFFCKAVKFHFFVMFFQKRPPVSKKNRKGAAWKFTLDCTHPVEDGILDSANFVRMIGV